MPVFIPSLEYEVIKVPLNHSLHTLCNLIVREIVIERELVFYSKYIDWDGVNKCGYEDHLIRWRIKIGVGVDCS